MVVVEDAEGDCDAVGRRRRCRQTQSRTRAVSNTPCRPEERYSISETAFIAFSLAFGGRNNEVMPSVKKMVETKVSDLDSLPSLLVYQLSSHISLSVST